VTRGNITELAATAVVAPLIDLLSVRTIGYNGEQCSGGEGGILCQAPRDLENRNKISVSGQPRWVVCTYGLYRTGGRGSKFRRMVNAFTR
jgi:hypothetical protein